jgi:hypothetical protein
METVPKTTDTTMSPEARELAAEPEEASQQTLARWRLQRASTSTATAPPAVPVQLRLKEGA